LSFFSIKHTKGFFMWDYPPEIGGNSKIMSPFITGVFHLCGYWSQPLPFSKARISERGSMMFLVSFRYRMTSTIVLPMGKPTSSSRRPAFSEKFTRYFMVTVTLLVELLPISLPTKIAIAPEVFP
jgi:hypothetical protein